MNALTPRLLAGLLALALLSCLGCAANTPPPVAAPAPPKSYVVLMHDRDDSAGAVEITNDKGGVLLDQPRHAISLDDPSKAPDKPYPIAEETIQKDFGRALALTPEEPIRFILYFQPGTSQLTEESKAEFRKVLPLVTARKYARVFVTGHTDRAGDAAYNVKLGLKRAMELRDLLVKDGLSPAQIETNSHGESNPLVPTPDGAEEAKNRRVEVIVR